jgi:polysaccharide biosynthesis/export protein
LARLAHRVLKVRAMRHVIAHIARDARSITLALGLAYVVAAALAAPRTADAGEYRLGPGDQLQVNVWGEDALTRLVTVRPDGRLSLPLVSEVDALGKTVPQLQQLITERLSTVVQDPHVSVLLVEPVSYKIYVLGQVTKPGVYQLHSPTSVLQAIAIAGGVTEFAAANRTVIHRRRGTERQDIRVKLNAMLQGGAFDHDVMLEADDVVIVP